LYTDSRRQIASLAHEAQGCSIVTADFTAGSEQGYGKKIIPVGAATCD
jgi:hypothetical protein